MTFMYLLMSVFHSPPWLRVICQRSSQLRPRESSREKLLVDKIHRPPSPPLEQLFEVSAQITTLQKTLIDLFPACWRRNVNMA
jgi:hypothetical protein